MTKDVLNAETVVYAVSVNAATPRIKMGFAFTAGLNPTRIAIGSGLEVTQCDGNSFTVPKGHLISGLEAKMHCGEFKIAPSISAALIDELKDFQRKVSESGRATYEARSSAHDDLVLACAIGVWLATNGSGEFTSEPIPFLVH